LPHANWYPIQDSLENCLYTEAGISPVVIENQAAYLAGWLTKFRDVRKLRVYAATQAQKAADFTLNRTLES
jgi:antirestriction protein ArdC